MLQTEVNSGGRCDLPMSQDRRKRREWLLVNLKLFAVKAYGVVIRGMLWRRFLINATGIVTGLLSMFLYARQSKGGNFWTSLCAKKGGAILLGAHYGPSLYLHTLQGLSIDAKVLVAP